MGKLYSFGCSHTAGTPNLNLEGKPLNDEIDYWKNNTYPVHVAKELGLENVNLARGGCSNKDVYRIFYGIVDTITEDDFVLFQPTFTTRAEFNPTFTDEPLVYQGYHEDTIPEWIESILRKTKIPKENMENVRELLNFLVSGDMMYIDNLIQLNTVSQLLELKKVKYMICGYFQDDFLVHMIKKYRKHFYKELEIVQSNYNQNPFNFRNPSDFLGLLDNFKEEKFMTSEWPENIRKRDVDVKYHIPNDGHWNEEGHKFQATRLIKKIRKVY